MRKNIATITTSVLAILLVFLTANIANAQSWNYNRKYTRAQVERIIRQVENRTDIFVRQFDNSLDNSRLDGTRREDNLNQRARNLEATTNELRREFNRRQNWWEIRQDVQRCLNLASDINVAMRNRRFNRSTENNWSNVRRELNSLAQVYNLQRLG